ncbi:putative conserved hypothetical protein [Afipia carboxidovorans OM5]|uniref:Peptidase C51 domain-containing protein n=1 Tax=Afipia carboxidovorans (strain ATCC 49405 / DSM 1227 / KCTC 32145 / OM5) TaxID=504832 RepID=B6JEH1_AFIC5|nr:TIGR02594 family protein [Afipia carboxidovorans]ACI92736.1 putative conserved hypothetical protein [Afipia carboxidovorans OM5]AEI03512.1 hypothetical protein OCA4_c23920 [Afipia carboxidovorans OM4]AEI07089.1 hypothetical protein OCA5_c23930 [Afipia carboxidovorans OM5]
MIRTVMVAALALACVSATAEARPRHYRAQPVNHCVETGTVLHPVCGSTSFSVEKINTSRSDRRGVPDRRVVATSFGGGGIVAYARTQIGNGAIYGRRNLWCARFMNYVLERTGYRGTGSDMARSFASYGRRISGPQVGAIAVMSRGRRGGHVGVVSGVDAHGNPIIISGNHNRRVAEAVYPRGRVYAYVMPAD